jgi:hypothetical protein
MPSRTRGGEQRCDPRAYVYGADLDAVPAVLTILDWGRVLGSYKAALDRQSRRRLIEKWATLSRQGRVLRAVGESVLTLLRSAVKARDPHLVRFLLLACTEWLPTERRLAVASRDRGRGEACKLCGCVSETNAHALLGCPATGAQRVRGAEASDVDHRMLLSGFGTQADLPGVVLRALPAWYDPSGDRVVEGRAHLRYPWLVTGYIGHDPIAAAVGVLPPGLRALGLCADENWGRLLVAGVGVARRAMEVYESRCRLMRRWWDSEDGRPHWPAAVRGQLNKVAARMRRREDKATRQFLEDHPERPGPRKRARVGGDLRPFSPPVDYFAPVIMSTPVDEAEDAYLDGLEQVEGLLRPLPPPSY